MESKEAVMANKGMPTKKRTTNREVMEKLTIIEGKVEEIDSDDLSEKQVELQRMLEEVQQALIRVVNQWDYQLNYHRNALAEVIGRVDLITGAISESVPSGDEQVSAFPVTQEREMPATSEDEASQPPPSE
jgi:uncharacterized protein YgbK (DUF1537 family)|tara:strand:+ start:2038 stop:2430 length:393 start_codon:yes stop_codon:yes gene_type:complete